LEARNNETCGCGEQCGDEVYQQAMSELKGKSFSLR